MNVIPTFFETNCSTKPIVHKLDFNFHRYATVTAWRLFGPVLIGVGTLGNLLSFMVLCGASFEKTTIGLILKILSIVDTSLLWIVLFRTVVLNHDMSQTYDIRNYSQVFCKGHFVVAYFLSHLSSWTIAVLSAERALAIAGSLAGSGSRKNIIISFVVLATVLAAIDSHLLKFVRFEVFSYQERIPDCSKEVFGFNSNLTNDFSPTTKIFLRYSNSSQNSSSAKFDFPLIDDDQQILKDEHFSFADDDCQFTVERKFCWLELGPLHRQLWKWVDALLFALAPFIVIIISNAIVARSIIKADKFRRSFIPSSFEDGGRYSKRKPTGQISGKFSEEEKIVFMRSTNEIQCSSRMEVKKRPLGKRAKSSTIMLLFVSLTFLVTTTPLIIYIIVVNITDDVSMEFVGCVCSLFYYAGNSTNFLQYCLSGSKFRKSLKMVFKGFGFRIRNAWRRFVRTCCCVSCVSNQQAQRHPGIHTPTKKVTEGFSLTVQEPVQRMR